MLYFEWRKTLIKQKGFLVIAIFVFLKIVLTLYHGYDYHYIIDKNPEGYAYYMNQYEGKITEDKKENIEEEYYAVTNAKAVLKELLLKWRDGKISKSEYEEKSKQYYERIKNTAVFNVVYNKYYYAKELPEERYIMDERGWNTLLSHGELDFILLLCLLIVLTPLFCNEYESGMDALLLSSSKGKYRTAIAKLLSGFVLAITLTIIFSIIEYMCVDMMVGLNNGSYPLKSLQFFKESAYYISLNQAFLITVLCRVLGTLLFVECVSIVSIFSKKSIITLFSSSVLVIFPSILFPDKSVLYYLPLPSGLLSGTGYLWGNTYKSIINEQCRLEKIIQFHKIESGVFTILLVGYVVEIVLLFLYCIKAYSGYPLKLPVLKKKFKKTCCCLCMVLACLTIFTSCKEEKVRDSFTFNTYEERIYGEAAGYAISLNEVEGFISAKNLKTGEEICLTRDPFEHEYKICAIYVRDDYCYYLVNIPGIEGIRIYCINMADFSQRLVYNSVKENKEDFYGIVKKEIALEDQIKVILGPRCFFLNEKYIYYVSVSELVRINRNTNRENVIAHDLKNMDSVVYHNGDIYYIDAKNRLSIYMEEDETVHRVDSVYTDKIKIENNRLVYRNLLEDGQVCYYDIN